jgi:hypothetical protein
MYLLYVLLLLLSTPRCIKTTLAGPERFELPTAGFEDQNSSTELRTDCMAPVEGIEPPPTVLETAVLPLYYTGIIKQDTF